MVCCLVSGGLGYIGSHICVELLNNNYDLIIIDNLSNSKISKLDCIKTFNKYNNQIHFIQIDLCNFNILVEHLETLLKTNNIFIDVIIHLAGLKSVAESIKQPIQYYENNLVSTLNLTKLMNLFNIKNIIFSSSATVYGNSTAPYSEDSPTGLGITNPYGKSKFIQEEILKDIATSNPNINIIILRYFNPISHLNDDFKEDPNGIPNNLYPYLLKVYNGELKQLTVFGNDYPNTRDGTCSRDFIHVVDLANAHLICSNYLISNLNKGLKIYNVGTGKNTTVLELIQLFEQKHNCKLNYIFGNKREGDLETSYSNVDLIYKELGWKSKYSIEDCV